MKYPVYTFRDQLVGYGSPFVQRNDDTAIRQFAMMINDPSGTTVSEYPQYYDLYRIGEFDDDTGLIVPLDAPELVVTGLSVKKGNNEVQD